MDYNFNGKMIDKKDPASENPNNQASYTEEEEEEVSEEGNFPEYHIIPYVSG